MLFYAWYNAPFLSVATMINQGDRAMSEYQIYHNPRCSKSRQTLALLEENGIQADVILYLEDTPDAQSLAQILKKLGIPARDLLRSGEEAYQALNLADTALSEQQLIEAMVKQPRLIERPIVVKGDQAVIGRPPESVLTLLRR